MVLPQGAAALAPLLVVEHLNHGKIVEEREPSSVELKDGGGGHVTWKREREGENSLL